jgi:hypothetical protein
MDLRATSWLGSGKSPQLAGAAGVYDSIQPSDLKKARIGMKYEFPGANFAHAPGHFMGPSSPYSGSAVAVSQSHGRQVDFSLRKIHPAPKRQKATTTEEPLYRFDWPRTSFLTFFLFDPRGVVRLAFGAAFLRATRFSFLRSSLSATLVVSATCNLFQSCVFRVPR